MTAAEEPAGDEAEIVRPRHRRGFAGWLRSFAVISIVGAVLAVTVLIMGVASLLARPTASRGVLPFDPGPVPTGVDQQPVASPSVSPSPRPAVSRSVAPSKSAVPSQSPSSSPQVPVRAEAEQATIWRGRIVNDHAGFSGTGFVDYDNVTGSYVQWAVTAPSAGKVTLHIRYANGSGSARSMDILVNGSLAVDELVFPPTGAWPSWETGTVSVTLVQGANTIRAVATTSVGGPNLDYLEIAP